MPSVTHTRRLRDKLRGAASLDPAKARVASAPKAGITSPIGAGVVDSMQFISKKLSARNITVTIIVIFVVIALSRSGGK